MIRIITTILLVVVCSLYYFPVSLQALPSVNSKMVVAAVGLALFGWEHLRRKSPSIRKDLLPVLVIGLLFSLSSFFSVVYNSTDDMVFATYFVSMCVWLGGAYCVVYLLRWMYGEVSLHTIFLYLGMMCAGQCVIAVMIDNMPALANFVNTVFVGADPEYFENNPRVYGIGAGFDTAGIRFSCVLLGLAYLIKDDVAQSKKNFYILLFLIIGIVFHGVGQFFHRAACVQLFKKIVHVLCPIPGKIPAVFCPQISQRVNPASLNPFFVGADVLCQCPVQCRIAGVELHIADVVTFFTGSRS